MTTTTEYRYVRHWIRQMRERLAMEMWGMKGVVGLSRQHTCKYLYVERYVGFPTFSLLSLGAHTVKNVAAEIHSNSTYITNSVGKRLNRAEVFSQFGALKMDPQLKGDRNRLDFSQFGWLNFSRYVFHSVKRSHCLNSQKKP